MSAVGGNGQGSQKQCGCGLPVPYPSGVEDKKMLLICLFYACFREAYFKRIEASKQLVSFAGLYNCFMKTIVFSKFQV